MPEAVLHTESFPEGYRLTATAERCWTCSARTGHLASDLAVC